MDNPAKFLLATDGVFACMGGQAGLDLSTLQGYKTVPKAWGTEIWLVNTDLFCAKLLLIEHGWQCSLHRHPVKSEWFMPLQGNVLIQFSSEEIPALLQSTVKAPGDSFYVPTGLWHRFSTTTLEGAVMLEVSSHHSDTDVDRWENSKEVYPF